MRFIMLGSLIAAVGVALGAFGAHGLKNSVTPELIVTWETAVRYHIYHALGLMMVGLLQVSPAVEAAHLNLVGGLMQAGIVLFSGSLYILVFTGNSKLGAVTPIGGLFFIAAWLTLAYAVAQG